MEQTLHNEIGNETGKKNYWWRNPTRRAFTYKALNRLIQGSAADQTKQAMINCAKAGYLPWLQIKDGLCFCIGNDKDIKVKKDKMENAVDNLKVPVKCDVALDRSWGEAKYE